MASSSAAAGGGAGELGHVSIDPGGARCACGGTGCLETVTSSTALLAAYARYGGTLPHGMHAGLRQVVSAYAKSEEAACKAVADVGRSLGIGLALAVNLLDPDAIVLCGDLAALGDALLEAARPTLSAFTLRKSGSAVAVHVSPPAEHAKARGAAAAAIERIFRDA
ncbi:MAG: ROK family protein [Planctomycetota bacterium]